jgi:hypothetical protein
MFGYGAREAVVTALRGGTGDVAPFGSPVPARELVAALHDVFGPAIEAGTDGDAVRCRPGDAGRTAVAALAFAHGWLPAEDGEVAEVRFLPATP